MLTCNICFDLFCHKNMTSASGGTLDGGPSSNTRKSCACSHFFCFNCMKLHIQAKLRLRSYPVKCPEPQCKHIVSYKASRELLGRLSSKEGEEQPSLHILETLEHDNHISPNLRAYCPFKDCSAVRKRSRHPNRGSPEATCAKCKQKICRDCNTAWHQGMTCSEFQSLAPHLRNVEDAAFLQLAALHHWKQCPECGFTVERLFGCNFVRCRCGTSFCYACGLKYSDTVPNAVNPHGTQSCTCGLMQ
ncbi:hypothetical protein CEUSTIGMA_g2289.t1 [Chlamydomonas eustigma]|uniref:RBR-type E3 ubiquitin transferase n=1 Tax=Chlamydomonas eustigma TaxID=1157962 RepID=A0A250WVH1_9CHLO|nr:hypothetical protein CEUSTIGMA_g2289.t1 [Chlamydomonas eustigma]|eukprot:GAX74843.1 hypothetical protein CEUSTIGMA_g2289.t1 [Chlamydomonas eustigma]